MTEPSPTVEVTTHVGIGDAQPGEKVTLDRNEAEQLARMGYVTGADLPEQITDTSTAQPIIPTGSPDQRTATDPKRSAEKEK